MTERSIFFFNVIEPADGNENSAYYDITEEEIRFNKTLIARKIFDKGRLVEEWLYDEKKRVQFIAYYKDGMLTRRECFDTSSISRKCKGVIEYVNGKLPKKECVGVKGGDDDQANI